LQEKANELNRNLDFTAPLSFAELRGIIKSVARFTWRNFSLERFSEIQSKRGIRGMASRWVGRTSLDESRPWEADGISRRTWFRRQKAASAQVPGGTVTISGNIGDRGRGADQGNPRLVIASGPHQLRRHDRAEQIAPNAHSMRFSAPANIERAPV
jgi:hypothetical protein